MEDDQFFKSSDNLEGQLDKIRELYLMHKELKSRHEVSMDPRTKARSHKLVYSSKQETPFLKDPDSQKLFREQIINKISEVPSLKPIPFYADQLLSEYLTSELKANPAEIRKTVSDYFFTHIKYLQQLKAKVLLDWGFLSEKSPEISTTELTERLKDIHTELDDYISRYERLRYDEEYENTRVRPSPKTEDGTNLFHEEPVVLFSSLAKDDLQKFIEAHVSKMKRERELDRFKSRLKWMWVGSRMELWKKSIGYLTSLHEKSSERIVTLKKTQNSIFLPSAVRENVDMPPTIITSTHHLQNLLNFTGSEFGLKTDLELDDGHSLAYQVTHLLPELFELQRQRLDWNPYGSHEEREKAAIRLANLQSLKVHRLSAIRKANDVAQHGDLEEPSMLRDFKLLDAVVAEWLGFIKLKPEASVWEKRQRAKLELCKRDSLLENAFNVLDLQDLPTVNKLLEEFSVGYADRSNKILKIKPDLKNNETYFKSYFTNIIIERNLDSKFRSEGVNLPPQCIKSLYTLRMIKSRTLKQKLLDILNIYRSIQKRLAYDMCDIGTREELRPEAKLSDYPKGTEGFNPSLHYTEQVSMEYYPERFPGLYGRRDSIEKYDGDYYVKNNKDLYIVYSIIDKDYRELIEELIKIGSYYIEKYETGENAPFIDRDFFAAELLEVEVNFQSTKLELILKYLEIYNHSIDTQDQVAQIITNLMALRPRLHLRSSYFCQSYWAHIDSIKQHISLLQTIIDSFAFKNPEDLLFDSRFAGLITIKPIIEECLFELNLVMEIESPLHFTALEYAAWQHAHYDWKISQCYSLVIFDDGVLLDNPKFVLDIAQELSNEAKSGNIAHFPVIPPTLFEGKKVKVTTMVPSELSICCNYFEAWRFRNLLEKAIIDCYALEEIYKKQASLMKKDILTVEHADWGVGLRHFPEVDEGPGSKKEFWLPAFEIDSKLKANFHFSHIGALKHIMLPWGIEELRSIYAYQIMHKHLLAIGVQINQNLLDKWVKQISEVEVIRDYQYYSTSFAYQISNLLHDDELNSEKVESEIKKIQSKIVVDSSKYYFDTKSRKTRNRQRLEGAYKRIAEKYKGHFAESDYIGIIIRNLRIMLLDGYCREVLRDAYHDAIKVQLCKIFMEYKRLLKIVPIDVYKDTFEGGEDRNRQILNESGEVTNIEFIPSVEEIMKMRGFKEEDRENWRGWEPYVKAETSDIQALHRPYRSREPIVSLLLFKNDWEFRSPLRTSLEVSVSVIQVVQIWTFLNLLGEKVTEVMNLQESTMAGENYWGIDIKNIGEKSKKKILDEMLDTQNPKYLLEEAIKRSLSNLKVMAFQFQDTGKNDEMLLAVAQSRRAFYILSLAIFQSLHHSLMHEKNKDSGEVIEFISYLFRYSRKKFSIHNNSLAPLFSNPKFEVLETCQRTVFITNENSDIVSGCYIWEFEWGMLEVSSEERNHTLATTTAMQLKMENLLSLRHSPKGHNSLELAQATCAYIAPELECWRLKTALFVLKIGDMVSDPGVYEKLLSQYKDILEWKNDKTHQVDTDDHIKNPISAEVILLKDIFNSKICISTIRFLQAEMDQLSKASSEEGAYTSTESFTCNIVIPYTDVHRKVGVLHNFLNVLRNRGSIVDAPSSGKALVFSVKDLTQLTKRFTEQVLRYVDGEFRIQEENHTTVLKKSVHEIMKKNQEIHLLKRNIDSLRSNIVNLVHAQLAQKGTQLIYELDISMRQLLEIRDNSKDLENQLIGLIRKELTEKIKAQQDEIKSLEEKFSDFTDDVAQEMKTDIDARKNEALSELKGHAGKYKAFSSSETKEETKQPKSKRTLVRIQEMIRKMLNKNQWERLQSAQTFDKHLQDLKSQLSSNDYLAEQLKESQRREGLLKQELSYTQQALSAAEKLAEKLQTQIEDMNSQRLRLQQYKASKGKRLSELEEQVKQYEKIEFLDNQKLLNHFMKQTRRIQVQKNGDLEGYKQYLSQHNAYQREIKDIKKKIKKERTLKLEAYDQLSLYKEEMQGIEQDQDPSLKLWQGRYYEMLEEVRNNKEDNMRLRERFVEHGDYEFIERFPDLIRPKSNVSLPSVHLRTPKSSSMRSAKP